MLQRDREVCTLRSCPIPAPAATRRQSDPDGLFGGSRRETPPPAGAGRRHRTSGVERRLPRSSVGLTRQGVPSKLG
jgi:hypothetical protein